MALTAGTRLGPYEILALLGVVIPSRAMSGRFGRSSKMVRDSCAS